MKTKQENRFSMYLAVVDFCEKNTSVTTTLPNFSINLSKLKTTCEQIHVIVEVQAADLSGTTAGKNDSRENLVVLGADTSRKLVAYATLVKNQKLLKEIKYTESDLRHLPDTTLADVVKLIYDRAQTHLASLASYQITAETQAALLQAIDDYKLALPAPRVEKVSQVQATKQLAALFATGDEALAAMDVVVEIVRLTEPDFYAGYKSVRKIIESGSGKLSVKGLVTEVLTGDAVPGVMVSFWPDGDMLKTVATGDASLVKKTAAKGGFNVSSLPAGTYRVTLQKPGYAEQTLTVYVNDGELTTVDVQLAKV
jgi:hypothetical protein